jgi:glycosyltransferase involved in cell wall biosynthesis
VGHLEDLQPAGSGCIKKNSNLNVGYVKKLSVSKLKVQMNSQSFLKANTPTSNFITPNKQASLRIMFFEEGDFGGSIVCLERMIKGLYALGCEIGYVSHYEKTGPVDIGSMSEVRFWRNFGLRKKNRSRTEVVSRTLGIPRPTYFGMRYFFTALHALRKFRPDIAYFNNEIESSIPAVIAAKLLRIATVCHFRRGRDLYPIEKMFTRFISKFIVLSKAGIDTALTNGISEQKLAQMYDPLYIVKFDKQTKEPLSINIPWENDCVYVIQVGALISSKRPILALDAFSCALQQCPKLRLILAGDGRLREQIEKEIKQHKLDGKVYLVGFCSQIPALLCRCHISLFVSASEGLGLVIPEAMAAGLPIITWGLPVFKELIQDGQTGIIVNQDTPECFAEALIKLYHSEELRRRIGKTGREWVTQGQFDINKYMKRLYDLLLNVANKGTMVKEW